MNDNFARDDEARHDAELAASIERGVADLHAGRTYTTDEVRAYLREHRTARAPR